MRVCETRGNTQVYNVGNLGTTIGNVMRHLSVFTLVDMVLRDFCQPVNHNEKAYKLKAAVGFFSVRYCSSRNGSQ